MNKDPSITSDQLLACYVEPDRQTAYLFRQFRAMNAKKQHHVIIAMHFNYLAELNLYLQDKQIQVHGSINPAKIEWEGSLRIGDLAEYRDKAIEANSWIEQFNYWVQLPQETNNYLAANPASIDFIKEVLFQAGNPVVNSFAHSINLAENLIQSLQVKDKRLDLLAIAHDEQSGSAEFMEYLPSSYPHSFNNLGKEDKKALTDVLYHSYMAQLSFMMKDYGLVLRHKSETVQRSIGYHSTEWAVKLHKLSGINYADLNADFFQRPELPLLSLAKQLSDYTPQAVAERYVPALNPLKNLVDNMQIIFDALDYSYSSGQIVEKICGFWKNIGVIETPSIPNNQSKVKYKI
ncbi:MAG: hypothetical protein ACOYK8_08645 [Alphaproteobacteria bacterium]